MSLFPPSSPPSAYNIFPASLGAITFLCVSSSEQIRIRAILLKFLAAGALIGSAAPIVRYFFQLKLPESSFFLRWAFNSGIYYSTYVSIATSLKGRPHQFA